MSSECRKYGKLTHIAVEKQSDGQVTLPVTTLLGVYLFVHLFGQVFLMYSDKKAAGACKKVHTASRPLHTAPRPLLPDWRAQVMNGRFFGGKKLDCNFVLEGD